MEQVLDGELHEVESAKKELNREFRLNDGWNGDVEVLKKNSNHHFNINSRPYNNRSDNLPQNDLQSGGERARSSRQGLRGQGSGASGIRIVSQFWEYYFFCYYFF